MGSRDGVARGEEVAENVAIQSSFDSMVVSRKSPPKLNLQLPEAQPAFGVMGVSQAAAVLQGTRLPESPSLPLGPRGQKVLLNHYQALG